MDPKEKMERGTSEHNLHFTVNQIPRWNSIALFGFQQMMICISGLLVIPFLVSEIACAGDQTIQLRVRLIAATFVTSGIATIIQTTFGLRLCILHGPSFAFLPPLIAFQSLPANKCDGDLTGYIPEEQWMDRLQTIQGSLACAVVVMILFGATGIVGKFAKFVGPITITPLLTLLVISTIPTLNDKMSLHWISIFEFCILIAFATFLENVHVPIPYFSMKEKKLRVNRVRLFGQFPYLIGIGLAWFLCFILTVTDLEPTGGEARTDKNMTVTVLKHSPWVQVPYPGQFGVPKISAGLLLGFVASTLACIMEGIGDYKMCAKVSHQRHPPASSVNRAIICEGLGSVLAAFMGVGTGVTTYTENIAVMHVTKVASRVTMQMAGVFLILLGVFTKCAALLASIPDALVGGVLGMGMAMISGVALSNLQTVDLRLTRNLTIMGTALLMGNTISYHFGKTPVNTGNKEWDDVLNMLLAIPMLIGGLIAFILDNTVGGATREQRGFPAEENDGLLKVEDDGYALPDCVNRFLIGFPLVAKLPFFPPIQKINRVSPSSKNPDTVQRSQYDVESF